MKFLILLLPLILFGCDGSSYYDDKKVRIVSRSDVRGEQYQENQYFYKKIIQLEDRIIVLEKKLEVKDSE